MRSRAGRSRRFIDALEAGDGAVEFRVFLPRADQVIEIRVLDGLGVQFQTTGESFDDDSVEALGFALGPLPDSVIDRVGDRPDRVLRAHGAGNVFDQCRQPKMGSKTMKAIIAGVTGAVGSAIARELASSGDWAIAGLSRNAPESPIAGVQYVRADLADAAQCRQALGGYGDATHLFYCGRATHREQVLEDAATNLALLDNVLSAAERGPLRHVHLVQGGKVYGVHVGPFPTPAREDDPRVVIENFNYDQEDLLQRRSEDRPWTWSASRPNTLLHFSPAIARNLVSSLGAYAAICRELGCALDFPGPEGAYRSLTQVTSIELLARAMEWMATEPACADQAFNVTNGDVFRWSRLWPRIAAAFDMACGSVRPLRLAAVMQGKEAVWDRIRERHGLAPRPLSEVANWGYLDATLERTWDEILSTGKARTFGFHDWEDSEERLLALIAEYRAAKILP